MPKAGLRKISAQQEADSLSDPKITPRKSQARESDSADKNKAVPNNKSCTKNNNKGK